LAAANQRQAETERVPVERGEGRERGEWREVIEGEKRGRTETNDR
jgi:hypothetical protein